MTADQNMLNESWVLWTSLGWWLGVLEGETLGRNHGETGKPERVKKLGRSLVRCGKHMENTWQAHGGQVAIRWR